MPVWLSTLLVGWNQCQVTLDSVEVMLAAKADLRQPHAADGSGQAPDPTGRRPLPYALPSCTGSKTRGWQVTKGEHLGKGTVQLCAG